MKATHGYNTETGTRYEIIKNVGADGLPKETSWEVEYEWDNKKKTKIRSRIRYDCGCEYTIILNRDGRTLEFDMGDTIWCETHDPTMPWVEDYDYKNRKWRDEDDEEEPVDWDVYGDTQYDGVEFGDDDEN